MAWFSWLERSVLSLVAAAHLRNVPCSRCGTMIQSGTAGRAGGLCLPCDREKDRLRCWKKWRWKRSCISRRQLCQWTNTGRCWRMCHCRQNSKRKISWNTLRTRIAGTSTCRYVPPECFLTSSLTSMQGGIVCRWEVAGRGSTSELTRAFCGVSVLGSANTCRAHGMAPRIGRAGHSGERLRSLP